MHLPKLHYIYGWNGALEPISLLFGCMIAQTTGFFVPVTAYMRMISHLPRVLKNFGPEVIAAAPSRTSLKVAPLSVDMVPWGQYASNLDAR
jgi:hypothetical protein